MKFLLSLLAALIAVHYSFAQTNTFPDNGNVGIGTTSPNGVLHLHNNVTYADNAANQLVLSNGGYRNSESGALPADNAAMAFYFTNYNAGGKWYDRTLDIKVRGAGDGTYGASMIRFFANDYTSGAAEREIMRIHGNGNVLIGKTTQVNAGYKLDVAGSVRANEIVVNTSGADFVFEPSYKLYSISSVKKYIAVHHHSATTAGEPAATNKKRAAGRTYSRIGTSPSKLKDNK